MGGGIGGEGEEARVLSAREEGERHCPRVNQRLGEAQKRGLEEEKEGGKATLLPRDDKILHKV